MIRIGRLHINPLFIGVLAVSYIYGQQVPVFIAYAITILHEMSHLIAAIWLGIEIGGIFIMPFGAMLKIHSPKKETLSRQLILYLAGAACNLLLAGMGFLIKHIFNLHNEWIIYFIFANMGMAVINLLPLLPLDGGKAFCALLSSKTGNVKAYSITLIISRAGGILIGILGVFFMVISKGNISLLIFAVFILCSFYHELELRNYMLMNKLIYSKQKLLDSEVIIQTNYSAFIGAKAKKVLKAINENSFSVVTLLNDDMRIVGVLTETQIIDAMVEKGSHISMKDIFFDNSYN